MFSEYQLYQRKKQDLKRKTPREQQRHVCAGNQTGATFVLHLENRVYFRDQTGSRRFEVPTIIAIKKQYVSITVTVFCRRWRIEKEWFQQSASTQSGAGEKDTLNINVVGTS